MQLQQNVAVHNFRDFSNTALQQSVAAARVKCSSLTGKTSDRILAQRKRGDVVGMIKKQSAWVLFHYENFQHKFMLCWYLSALIGLFTLNNQSECLKISEKIFIGSSLEVTAQC